ncbi:hypothetical protein FRC09_014455 [Ceratobasidium sp. 395]|nr:hypothetical protein FRC09_014455 [Ceratobasidium sp. 395]
MDKITSKIEKSVKKRLKKLSDRTSNNPQPGSTPSSLSQGPSAPAIAATSSQLAVGQINNSTSQTTTPAPHLEPEGVTQPPVVSVAPGPSTEQGVGHDSWLGLKAFARVISEGSEPFAPLKNAIGGMLEVAETFELAAQNRGDYQKLRAELNTLLHDLAGWFGSSAPPTMTSSIVNLANKRRGIERELEIIRQNQDRSGVRSYVGADADADQILEHYRGVQRLLERLALNADLNIWQIVNEQTIETRLSKLPNSPAARYRSAKSSILREECTPNTRVEVLEELYEWARGSESQKIYWLNGMAGTGKTTIAYSFCKELERSQGLAASFFCSRQLQECHEVDRVVPTISYQLSRFSLPFRAAVCRVLEADPDVHNQPLLDQFRELVFEPLVKVKDALPTSVVVVIDALDECDNNRGADILKCLLLYARDLPVKFFVASRPDAKILDSMRRQNEDCTPVELRLHDLDRSIVEEDIRTYLLTKIASHVQLPAAHLEILVKRSGVLFIYAATVARYISADNFSRAAKRLKEVLTSVSNGTASSSDKDINELYSMILAAAFGNPSLAGSDRADMKQILNTVVCAQEPLSVEVMAGLLGFDGETVHAALRPLLSVLQVSDTTHVITTLHESFPDYLLDKSRSSAFYCNSEEQNAHLTRICFGQIEIPDPPFNICGLESSYIFDKDVPDLPARVKKAISKELRYACHYWGVHIMLSGDSRALASMLLSFLSDRLLLWLEVVNLCEYIYDCVRVLHHMQRWAASTGWLDNSIKQFLRDAWKFAASFSSSPARLCTPHLYISALTFWPNHSLIKKYYKQDSSNLMTSASTAMKLRGQIPLSVQYARSAILGLSYSSDSTYVVSGSLDGTVLVWDAHTGQPIGQPMEGHTGYVRSVACSPDGAYIISGSDDKTIRIWDAYTRQPAGQPLEGHTGRVMSVAYSPDGAYIVSGSDDITIRIWDARTHQPVGEPLKGHSRSVKCVTYSPDGAFIVSGSYDGTIRIWNAYTRQPVGQPIKEHTDTVYSVAYSPDGACIVSGSGDNTIRIWDVHTHQQVGQPLEGHTSHVNSVAYSPDGAYIVSGSYDYTVCVWDAHTHRPVGQPLEGHGSPVFSVACSPDGMYILSGSHDGAIRIWDAYTQPGGQSFEGHTSHIRSVAYSPDSAFIVSGSFDNTIRIWDSNTHQPVGQQLEGHTSFVNSVAYSPDGECIVSGSGDKTIRIWDAHTRQPAGQPLEGHTGDVWSVAYSPDGAYIVSGSHDKTIRIWDAHAHQQVGQPLEGHTSFVNSVAYSPDGECIVSGSGDKTIRIWDAHTRQPAGQPLEGHTDDVWSVSYSPDGAYIISGSGDNTIRIWDVRTRQLVGQPLKGHTDLVRSVTYSSDGVYIVSGSDDNTVRIWDARACQPVGQQLEGHVDAVMSVSYSPDGAHVTSGSQDETVRIWDTLSVIPTTVTRESYNIKSQVAHYSHSAPIFWSTERIPLCNLGCQSNCPHMAWILDEDGWIFFNDGNLIWVPPDLQATLLSPQGAAVIFRRGCLHLNLDSSKLGDRWCENFRPGGSAKP